MCTSYKLKEIDDRLKARVLRLVKMSAPLGLEVSQFVELFGLYFDSIDQTLRQLRIQDAFHLFDILKHELPINVSKIDGQYKVFIKSNEELIDWTVRQTRNHRFVVPNTLIDTPPNVVLPGESFREPRLPEKFKPGNYEYVAVYISSAVNPHEIYIQFKGQEYHTSLETLMYSLDFYETVREEQWAVPIEFLYVGYPVICRYPGM